MIKRHKEEILELLHSTIKQIQRKSCYSNIEYLTYDELDFLLYYMLKYKKDGVSLKYLEQDTERLIEILSRVGAISQHNIFALNSVMNMYNIILFGKKIMLGLLIVIITGVFLICSFGLTTETRKQQARILSIDTNYNRPCIVLDMNNELRYYFLENQKDKNLLTRVKENDIVELTEGKNLWRYWIIIDVKEVKNE